MSIHQVIAGVTGAAAVGLGAFGAHGLETMLAESGRTATWETAVFYHLVHSVVLLLTIRQDEVPGQRSPTSGGCSFWLFFGGIAVFSGSLYLLCLTGQTWLGAITPLGGLSLMAGWIGLAFQR